MKSGHLTIAACAMVVALVAPLTAEPSSRTAVTCLGRLEPGDGALDVSTASGERLQTLEVVEGQFVKAGQTLARLESYAERRAVADAQRALVAEMGLAVRRNRELKPLEIEAQEAAIRRLDSELAMARIDLERLADLRRDELVNEQAFDHQDTVTRQVEEDLAEAGVLLRKMRAEQVIELLESEARLQRARADLASAEERMRQAEVRAPIDGRVLKIFTWPGERVGTDPILRMGETGRMYAVAEVYETDVRHVRGGRPAIVRSPALPVELTGVVERIGSMVHKNDVLGIDPAAETDARVVEVRIRLADSEVASRYVHLQVDIEIVLEEGGSSP